MKICRLRAKEFELFDWLDPYGLLKMLTLPNRFALVATETDEEGKGDSPAGLMIGGINENSVFCEWICVDLKYRDWGIAESLISELSNIASKNSKEKVEIRFIMSSEMKDVVSDAKIYFKKLGFEDQNDLSGEETDEYGKLFEQQEISVELMSKGV